MNKITATFKALVAVALLACAGSALAQSSAQIRWNSAIYSGPGDQYPTVGYVNAGRNVSLYGCLSDYAWCEVSNGYDRGWVDADVLGVYRNNQVYDFYSSRSWFTYPIISFVFADYWRSHYYSRPWYNDRDRYSHWNWRRDDHRWNNRPGHGRPDYNRPDYNRPGNNGRPDYNRPGNGRPDYNRPGNNNGRPDYNRPGNDRPDHNRPGNNTGRPDYNRPGGTRPGVTPPRQPISVPGSRPMTPHVRPNTPRPATSVQPPQVRPNPVRPNPSVQPPRGPQPQVSQPRSRSDQPARSTPSKRPARSDGNQRQQER